MGAHVADGADAPIGPAAPVEGVVDGVVVDVARGCPEKQIPCESTGDGIIAAKGGGETLVDVAATPFERFRPGLQRLRARDDLRPIAEGTIGPDVHFANVADGAGPDVLDGGASIVRGVALVAHLRGDFGFLGAARKLAGFFDGPAEWLLEVDEFAAILGREVDKSVYVVVNGDVDGVTSPSV